MRAKEGPHEANKPQDGIMVHTRVLAARQEEKKLLIHELCVRCFSSIKLSTPSVRENDVVGTLLRSCF
jgi:hypothetical protein